jgi:hypothetical protein
LCRFRSGALAPRILSDQGGIEFAIFVIERPLIGLSTAAVFWFDLMLWSVKVVFLTPLPLRTIHQQPGSLGP